MRHFSTTAKAYTNDNPILAYWGRPKPRAGINMWMGITITLVLAAYRLITEVSLPLNRFFGDYTQFRIGTTIMNGLFFWLLALLWIAYRRWQTAEGTRQELERIVSSINPDVLIVVEADHVISICTGAVHALFGYAHEEIVGQTTALLYTDERADGPRRELNARPGADDYRISTATGLHRDGDRFPIEVVTAQIKSDPGGEVMLLREMTDMQKAEEERRHLEMQVQRAQKLESLGLLGGGIAHDFNNLLMGILGNADLALMQIPNDSAVRHYIEDVVTIARRAADLTNQLLAYSGEAMFTTHIVDLGDLAREITHLLKISINKKAQLVFELADEPVVIECDVTQIRQIIMNLVINASDALQDQPGTITVATGLETCSTETFQAAYFAEDPQPGDYVFLRVTDDGCGMDQTSQERMFDPFFSTKFTGRGLGLASVLGIVRAHKGAIAVTSRKNSGTVFTVYIPVSSKAIVAPAATATETADTWRGDGTVLIVDDEETVRAVAEQMLQYLGFDTQSMTNGQDALTWFKAHAADITAVLMDMTMPIMDGIEAAREIRTHAPEMPIILSSGYNRYENLRTVDPVNPPHFLHKPYRLDTIRTLMRNVLEAPDRKDDAHA